MIASGGNVEIHSQTLKTQSYILQNKRIKQKTDRR